MKILHVITTLDVGGAEMHILHQVRGQVARGNEVRVAYLLGEGTLVEDFAAAGASWVGCVGKGLGFPFALRKHLRWCDLVHSHLLRADFATALTALVFGARKKLIAGKHNDEQALTRPLVSRVHGFIGNLPARTIVLSDHVGRFIQQHGRVEPSKMTRIYYGLDRTPFEQAAAASVEDKARLRAEFGFGEDEVVFICVARFARQKAHEILIEAFARAREQAPVRLLLVGGDPFHDGVAEARAVAEAQGVIADGTCVFAGIRRDVPALMAASDVFTMASRWEGLGLVFLEAMSTGMPVLSTNVSAIPEVVVEGETGLLVPPDDVPALTAGMLRMAGDADLRAGMSQAGRARVREVFGLDRMVDETLAVYREVAGG
ncbi:MAG: glycosyltransferase family 4 protein [Planctomycetota bacterium]|nr:glycosyltransferase family 4 protein [Planctomycetota bacterium]